MYKARLTPTDAGELATPGDDRPIVRWPKPQIRRCTAGDRMIVQLGLSREVLAELAGAEGEIELHVVPEEALDEQ
jgi:hypothetical protein